MQCPEQKVCTESSRQTFRSTGLWFKWKKQNKTLFPVHKIENVKESCSFGLHSGRVKHLHWERDVLWRQALKLLFQNQIIHLVIWGKKYVAEQSAEWSSCIFTQKNSLHFSLSELILKQQSSADHPWCIHWAHVTFYIVFSLQSKFTYTFTIPHISIM